MKSGFLAREFVETTDHEFTIHVSRPDPGPLMPPLWGLAPPLMAGLEPPLTDGGAGTTSGGAGTISGATSDGAAGSASDGGAGSASDGGTCATCRLKSHAEQQLHVK